MSQSHFSSSSSSTAAALRFVLPSDDDDDAEADDGGGGGDVTSPPGDHATAVAVDDVCMLVDYRERELLRDALPFLDRPFPFAIVNAEAGDILICVKLKKSAEPPLASSSSSSSSSSQRAANDGESDVIDLLVDDDAGPTMGPTTPGGRASRLAGTVAAAPQAAAEVSAYLASVGWTVRPEPYAPDTFEYVPIFVIERKAVPDLVGSIQSGGRGKSGLGAGLNRFKDQKMRLLALARATGARPFVVVEGLSAYGTASGPRVMIERMPEDAIFTALTHTSARDGVYVQHTHTPADTARWLGKLCRATIKYGLVNAGPPAADGLVARRNDPTMAGAVSIRKADNMTPTLGFQTWLMTARGMTPARAEPIVARYRSLASLVDAYRALERQTLARKTPKQTTRVLELMLADLEIAGPSSLLPNGRHRRLGPALSRAVYVRLFNAAPEEKPSAPTTPKRKKTRDDDDDDDDDDEAKKR